MARGRDFLQRFRAAGAPGAAAATGVPADRVAELSSELEPVLAVLADVQDEADRVRAAARREADRRRREATQQAQSLVATARREAESERADAAAQVSSQAEAEGSEVRAEAERVADEVRRRAGERIPDYVTQVLATVRREAWGPGP